MIVVIYSDDIVMQLQVCCCKLCDLLFQMLSGRDVDRLCGLVVRVPDYRHRSPGFDSQRYQIF
jgi:hypothetical protein